jgi:hypothetical protein
MHLAAAHAALRRRFRRPAVWAVAMLVPALSGSVFLFIWSWKGSPGAILSLWMLILIWWVVGVFLSPIPWQWGPRALPGAVRGFLQATLFLGLWGGTVALLGEMVRMILHRAFHLGHWLGGAGAFTILSLPLLALGFGLARTEHLEAEVRDAEAQAQALEWAGQRTGFPPQLLFETLESLAAGASGGAPPVEQGLLNLAALYRQWLIQGQASRATLAEERDLLERYLSVEQQRMGPHLRLRARWPEGMDSWIMPSLSLLGLVQGSLELAKAASVGVDLQVTARREGEGLTVEVDAGGRMPTDGPPSSILEALRVRMAAWEGGGSLTVHRSEGRFRVVIQMGAVTHADL